MLKPQSKYRYEIQHAVRWSSMLKPQSKYRYEIQHAVHWS